MVSARERAISFLHQQLQWVRDFDDGHVGEAWPERDGRVAGTLGALQAVGLLDAPEATSWRRRLSVSSAEKPSATPAAREAAERLLEELLAAVTPDASSDADLRRFQGALLALRVVRAADAVWDERLRQRMGWPSDADQLEWMRGGTQEELVAVLPGPIEAVDGVRVLYALRFSDGVDLTIWRERDWTKDRHYLRDGKLVDDVGTTYRPASAGGGGRWSQFAFRTAPPSDATWLELRDVASKPIRVDL